MPPRPPLASTVRIELVWAGPNGVKANNIMHALMGTGWDPTVANLNVVAGNVVTALGSTAGNHIMATVCTTWSNTAVNVYDNGGTTENEGAITGAGAGGNSGTSLPPNCASAISWQIPAHYRGGHPRTYLAGLPESDLSIPSGNTWSSAARSAFAAAWQSFLTSFNAGLVSGITEALGNIAYSRNNVPLTTPVFYPFSGGIAHARMDSQRRRLGKEATFG